MNCRNQKGMTLIEVVISIMILAIAMTIIYTGFVSASNILLSSKQYTKQVQDQKQCMLNGSGSEIDVKLKLTQNGTEVEIEGEYHIVDKMRINSSGACEVISQGDQGVQPFVKFYQK